VADHAIAELAASVFGALELERAADGIAPLRLPAWTRAQHATGGIDRMSAQTSGVRIRLLTAASTLVLDATFTSTASRAHPARPFTVVAETPGTSCAVTLDEGDVLLEAPDGTAMREHGARGSSRSEPWLIELP
jgi:hypothetical protein